MFNKIYNQKGAAKVKKLCHKSSILLVRIALIACYTGLFVDYILLYTDLTIQETMKLKHQELVF